MDARGDKCARGDKYCTITHTCFEQHIEDEYMWLENTSSVLKDDVEA